MGWKQVTYIGLITSEGIAEIGLTVLAILASLAAIIITVVQAVADYNDCDDTVYQQIILANPRLVAAAITCYSENS